VAELHAQRGGEQQVSFPALCASLMCTPAADQHPPSQVRLLSRALHQRVRLHLRGPPLCRPLPGLAAAGAPANAARDPLPAPRQRHRVVP
jgi:hypothetical protein